MSTSHESDTECAYFCTVCGAECWHLKGSDVDTCRRGHHHACLNSKRDPDSSKELE